MPFLRGLDDPLLRSAWRRVLALWRPMAGWTLLVWAVAALVLAPLSTALPGRRLLGPEVVANEALLAWLFTPGGALYVLLAGGVVLVGSVVRFAGLFHIVTDDLEGHRPRVRRTALHLLPELPSLYRLCVAAAGAGAALLLPMVAGLLAIRGLLLAEHDVNYYLAERPAVWRAALAAAGVWCAAWLAAGLYLAGRVVLAVPAHLEGHRPLRGALRRAWLRTHGEPVRLLRVLAVVVAGWLLVRAAVGASLQALAGAASHLAAAAFDSMRPILLTAAAYIATSFALDAVLGFLGFSLAATVVTKFYLEDTDLHRSVPPGAGIRQVPRTLLRGVRHWLRPRRLLPLLGLLLAVSLVVSWRVLDPAAAPRAAIVTAHRAGPPPAPENTLAALELAIAAGADYAEIDVQRSRDGVGVVVHDEDLMRIAGDARRVRDTPYAELRRLRLRTADPADPDARIATLEEFLERARGRIRLNIELKPYGDRGLAAEVVRRVRAAGAGGDVVLMALDLPTVLRLAELAPGIPVGYAAAIAVGDLSGLPVDFLAVSRPQATGRLVAASRARGLELHVWTVNDAGTMAELIERGVDGIITDHPELAVRVNRELAELTPVGRVLLRVHGLVLDEE